MTSFSDASNDTNTTYIFIEVICAAFDHVIEMCYANQYRVMHDNSSVTETPVTKTISEQAPETDALKN